MLLAVDLHEDFVDVEGVAVASVLSLQSAGVFGSKLDAPETDRFPSDDDASLGQQVFDICVAKIKAIIEPHRVTDDVWREAMAFIDIHSEILSIPGS